ncbi:peptide ABC transporter [Thermobispora bispora]|uniref:Extracellular solute-binding protein family 5 n=1 Tax=Thermobispora bispora (strain ATCC 19993 / DSM 43833 / CBS 139.67 / JCM 10125 / KCTC 9307 / NBRC 14880 / R51) TaxID=469371 RepID=D6YAU6_THEBD|nr:ABC transporter substrate-binding protein [Thermobispora bispora]ADG88313.1 extracellular solute-binding protein family 5 [Thermobispora bispora DSM 43833]MBO2474916.1 peptide ABC transporter [Actinomycetales bacterium]MBX6169113.1 ABC transporter substrate-binding protein [Thermobispora bispora]QSI48136.1 ABC transporter substrate-binding protein [Thermobispora bispora]
MKLIRGSLPLVLLAVLTACGAQTPAASPGTSLTWAIETEPITFNPHQWSQNKARLLVFNQFDALVARDANGEFIPWLAKSWRVSPDGKTYTFELRDDVTFHDGERFDAAAVKANLDKLREPGYNPTVASIQLRWLDRVEVVSPTTVKITLKRPDGLFLDFLASPYAAQVSPRSLRTAKDLKAGGPDVVGTGPFILDRHVRGQEVRYRRNPAYRWAPASAAHQGPAHLAEITYRFLPEGAVRVGALTSGQVQVIEGVPATDIASIENDPELTLQTALNSGSAFSYYFNTSRPPFDDKRVRQAFREAVDLDAVLESVYRGTATRAWSIVARSSPFYDPSLEGAFGGDAAKANALLDAAGWTGRDAEGYRVKDGERLTVRLVQSAPYVRDRRDVLAQAIQAQVKQRAGIDLQIRLVDQGTAQEAFDRNEYELFENSRGDTDAGAALNLILPKGAAINRHHFTDPKIDEWLAQASASSDPEVRKRLYAKVQRAVVLDEAIVFPLYVPSDQIAAHKSVQGLGFDPVSGTPQSAYDVRIGT